MNSDEKRLAEIRARVKESHEVAWAGYPEEYADRDLLLKWFDESERARKEAEETARQAIDLKDALAEKAASYERKAECAETALADARERGMRALGAECERSTMLVRGLLEANERAETAERELERWRHGATIEGDFVCPNELRAVNAEAALAEERAKREADKPAWVKLGSDAAWSMAKEQIDALSEAFQSQVARAGHAEANALEAREKSKQFEGYLCSAERRAEVAENALAEERAKREAAEAARAEAEKATEAWKEQWQIERTAHVDSLKQAHDTILRLGRAQ